MTAANTKKVVIAALSGNVAIAVCKFTAAFLSGSTATLAEAVHSLADSGNQLLLLIGIGLAIRPATEKFPFGRAAERYFWPFVVALMLFSVGGAFAIIEGIIHLIHGGETPANGVLQFDVFGKTISCHAAYLNYGVLGTSFLFEAMSFRVALREFKVLAKGQPLRKALFEARDPTIPLVLAEDTTALFGLGIALAAVVLSGATGNSWWDPLGSLIIGVLLCAVAVILARVTHGLLIGESATLEDQAHVLRVVEEVEGVDRVTQLLTMHLGPDEVVLALKIAFRPDIKLFELEETTNLIEAKLRSVMPQMRKIFIEPDSKGDGRGLKNARALSGVDEASL